MSKYCFNTMIMSDLCLHVAYSHSNVQLIKEKHRTESSIPAQKRCTHCTESGKNGAVVFFAVGPPNVKPAMHMWYAGQEHNTFWPVKK